MEYKDNQKPWSVVIHSALGLNTLHSQYVQTNLWPPTCEQLTICGQIEDYVHKLILPQLTKLWPWLITKIVILVGNNQLGPNYWDFLSSQVTLTPYQDCSNCAMDKISAWYFYRFSQIYLPHTHLPISHVIVTPQIKESSLWD